MVLDLGVVPILMIRPGTLLSSFLTAILVVGTPLVAWSKSFYLVSGLPLSSHPELLLLVKEVLLLLAIVDIPLLLVDKVDPYHLPVLMVKEVQLIIMFVSRDHCAHD